MSEPNTTHKLIKKVVRKSLRTTNDNEQVPIPEPQMLYDRTGKVVRVIVGFFEGMYLDMPSMRYSGHTTINFTSKRGRHYTCMLESEVEYAHRGVKCSRCEKQAYGKLKIKIIQFRDENGVDIGIDSVVAQELRIRAGENTTWCPEHTEAVADILLENNMY